MTRPHLGDDAARALAEDVLGRAPTAVEPIATGFGNRSWRVDTDDGRFVLKVGPASSAAKWASARVGHSLATRAGIPTQEAVHFSVRDDVVVRAFRWADGTAASALLDDSARQARLGADLGEAVARLHEFPRVSFSSRLEGSAPTFPRWNEYVHHRLGQIDARARGVDVVDEKLLGFAAAEATALADEVTDVARMTLCHRDLHADNLVVDADGGLVAILDWDMAETWDQAGEWFKLDWMLFETLPGCRTAFDEAYDAVHPGRPDWERRVRLVQVLEALNAAVNAEAEGWTSFGVDCRALLDRLLAER